MSIIDSRARVFLSVDTGTGSDTRSCKDHHNERTIGAQTYVERDHLGGGLRAFVRDCLTLVARASPYLVAALRRGKLTVEPKHGAVAFVPLGEVVRCSDDHEGPGTSHDGVTSVGVTPRAGVGSAAFGATAANGCEAACADRIAAPPPFDGDAAGGAICHGAARAWVSRAGDAGIEVAMGIAASVAEPMEEASAAGVRERMALGLVASGMRYGGRSGDRCDGGAC